MSFLVVEPMEIHLQPVTRAPVEMHLLNGVQAHAATITAVTDLQLRNQHHDSRTCVVEMGLTGPRRASETGQYQREQIALPTVNLLRESMFRYI